jgi:uncharacterized protein YqgV (UPF0045/DUF77 family)
MPIYVDGPKFIKVLRVNEGAEGARRTRLGIIMKSDFSFRADKDASATEAEVADMQQVIQVYQSADEAQTRADMLRFPEIARKISEYCVTSATEAEKSLIATALQEALRATRKADKAPVATAAE